MEKASLTCVVFETEEIWEREGLSRKGHFLGKLRGEERGGSGQNAEDTRLANAGVCLEMAEGRAR